MVLNTRKGQPPVLVIKPQAALKSDKMKILFATDGSDYSYATAEFLSSLPFPDNTELTIVNVMRSDFLDVPERFFIEVNERVKEVLARVKAREFTESEKIVLQAREYLNKKLKNIQVLSRVGDPSTEILRIGETMEADIIAVGCRGLRGMKGIMGSVSRNILAHSTCSVLIGKTCKE